MSLITRNNYEAYLLDYVEGNLSLELIAELMLFLEMNPELKEDLDDFEIHELLPGEINLADKSRLKQNEGSIMPDNYEELIIAEIEGVNTPNTSKELHAFLAKNPNKQADFIAYQKTRLSAGAVIFENKESLKKKERKVIPMYFWYSSAAAVIIILFLLNVLNNGEGQNNRPIAEQEEVVLPLDKKLETTPEETVIEENEVAAVKEKQIIHPKPKDKKTPIPFVVEEKEDNPFAIADNVEKETPMIKDSIPQEIIKELPVEEIQYADNVKITYEDEVISKKKITKINMVQTAILQRAKESNLNKAKEKLILAFNSKPLSFLKKKDKN